MKNCSRFLFVATLILTFVFVATADAPKLTFKFTTIEVKGAQDTPRLRDQQCRCHGRGVRR